MICYVTKQGERVPIKLPDASSLPRMMRIRVLARMIGVSYYFIVSRCLKMGVPIALSGTGPRKIKMVSPRLFFEKLKEVEAFETI